MKIYIIRDKKTGKELAAHCELGETLLKWLKDCKRRGFDAHIVEENIP